MRGHPPGTNLAGFRVRQANALALPGFHWRREMQVAGIGQVGARVEMIEVSEPRPLAGDEVLVEVRAAGVAN
jgi:hypothetical protein